MEANEELKAYDAEVTFNILPDQYEALTAKELLRALTAYEDVVLKDELTAFKT